MLWLYNDSLKLNKFTRTNVREHQQQVFEINSSRDVTKEKEPLEKLQIENL
jgi:hypothetical protein